MLILPCPLTSLGLIPERAIPLRRGKGTRMSGPSSSSTPSPGVAPADGCCGNRTSPGDTWFQPLLGVEYGLAGSLSRFSNLCQVREKDCSHIINPEFFILTCDSYTWCPDLECMTYSLFGTPPTDNWTSVSCTDCCDFHVHCHFV